MKKNGKMRLVGDPVWELEQIRLAGKKINRSSESARRFLLRHGFITADGRLAKAYR